MIRFRKRAKSIRFILNQTTRSLKERASLLKSSDLISMAPGSQEATFLSEDEHKEGESSMARVSDKVPLAGRTKSITSTDVGSPRELEAEDTSSQGVGRETRWPASKEEIPEEMVAK
jgi:hypothetical protein